MKTLILDSTKTIEAVLSTTPSVQPDFTSHYADAQGTTFIERSSEGTLNGTNSVTIVSSPAVGFARVIRSLTIVNKDVVDITVTVTLVTGSGTFEITKVTLNPRDTWTTDGTYTFTGAYKRTGAGPSGFMNSFLTMGG